MKYYIQLPRNVGSLKTLGPLFHKIKIGGAIVAAFLDVIFVFYSTIISHLPISFIHFICLNIPI
jgi:hypothetical protein